MNQNLTSYLTGLTNLASSISKNIGPSYMESDCFKKENYIKEFSKYYGIDEQDILLKKYNITLEEFFKTYLGPNKLLLDSLIYWIEYTLGTPQNIYTANDKLLELISRNNKGISPFYTLEDIIYVEFKKYIVCFMIGNNE